MKTARQVLEKNGWSFSEGIVSSMKEYAAIVATDTRKRCAKQATVKHTGTVAGVDKQSILDVEILTP